MWKKHSFYDERKACKKSIKQCHENYEKHLLEFMSHSIRHVGQKGRLDRNHQVTLTG